MMTDEEVKMNLLNEKVAWNFFAEYTGDVVRLEKNKSNSKGNCQEMLWFTVSYCNRGEVHE